jgi:glutathione S-transferase
VVSPPERIRGGCRLTAKLYVILGSHACRSGILTLEHKGIDHKVVHLPTGMHPFLVRLRGFPAREGPRQLPGARRRFIIRLADRFGTVPALAYGDERVQTNMAISRFLDEVRPDPPLFPAAPDERARVEEAEAFGNDFQMAARRLALAGVLRGPDGMLERGRSGRLGPLLWHWDWLRFTGTRFLGPAVFGANRGTEPALLEALPGLLNRIDGWIADGVLNGGALYAADFMIAPSLALLGYRRDLRPELESRPLWTLVDRLLPEPSA